MRTLVVLAAQAAAPEDRGWLAENATLVVGVVGIIVSGVIGPSVVAWFTARRERAKDKRALIIARRDDVRAVVDEAATVLSGAVGALRPLLLAELEHRDMPPEPRDFLGSLEPLGQRLRLRLPADHKVVKAYDRARQQLEEVPDAVGSQGEFEAATENFETVRGEFLEEARKVLQAPLDEDKEM